MSSQPATTPGAVFLSYAREDAEAARRIADALGDSGVEVWFDLHELRGGDVWEAKIRKQIRECSLFVPIVSAHTQARAEGYFRREWHLAIDRLRDISTSRAFMAPVAIDSVPANEADVPEGFLRYQWTQLAGGAPTPEFVAQIKRLLEPPAKGGGRGGAHSATATRGLSVAVAVGERAASDESPARTRSRGKPDGVCLSHVTGTAEPSAPCNM